MPSITERLLEQIGGHYEGQHPPHHQKAKYKARTYTTFDVPGGIPWYRPPFEVLGCTPDCRICKKQYRPQQEQQIDSRVYEDELDDSTAQRIASTHIKAITQDRKYLQDIIEKHGNAILNRWSKKNETQRRELVKTAVPDLYIKKMPQAHIMYAKDGWAAKRPFRKTLLLPYLTVENLCDNKLKLPSLLHNRTSRTPEEWVLFDSEQFRDAYARGSLGLKFNAHCVVMHGDAYGRLVSWEKEKAHSWAIVGWPRAQLILEAQETLLGILRKLVEKLLSDCDISSGCGKWSSIVSVGLKAPGTQELWTSFGAQPFLAPPSFEPKVLLELARTRQAAAEDELWLLQTDPPYALAQISKLRKLDLYKAISEVFKDSYTHIATEILNVTSNRAMMWRWVAQELQYVCQLHETAGVPTVLGEPIPVDYGLTIGSLYTLVKNLISQRVHFSAQMLASYPGMQEHFEIVQDAQQGPMLYLKQLPTGLSYGVSYFEHDLFFWIVEQLHNTGHLVINSDRGFYFGILDDWLAGASKTAKARVDQRLYDLLTDLAGMQLILSSLRCRRPYCAPVDEKTAVRTQSDRGDDLATWRDCMKDQTEESKAKQSKSPGALLKVFHEVGYPRGKQDAAWLAQADRSRVALQAFWEAGHSVWHDVCISSKRSQGERDYELGLLRQGLHPSHLAEVEKERARILNSTDSHKSSRIEPALPDWAANSALPSQGTGFKKTKTDIHATAPKIHEIASAEMSLKVDVGSTLAIEEPAIKVNKESLGLFNMMFEVTGQSGTLRWQRFVSAMVDAGCAAISNGGSAVTFRHATGSIAFHRPHPEDEIVPDILRIMGKRLTKRLGWSAETFSERVKGEAKAQ
ncbi:hypothetical protein LTR56_026121 [Elasticomyces elasticus]|nr:hypothetical protein LTR56_026121 [Elasticomyces elasticus]KAK3618806.1 hypothetical protein LTR22_026237 [Elasticomyces elasticus]KAK4903744.1 hypothetical protein LTR49_026669 [Elasticomyces elasticus]KAK5737960.1 hypothetical protein LTS12_025738 [Elasticomyces elasticus]